MQFTVSARELNDQVVLTLTGELDLSSKGRVATYVDQLLASGRTSIRADVSRVTFCDSSGLATLIRAKRLCEGAGGSFGIFGAVGEVASLLQITGLDATLCLDV
jgi:anti-sigma B factor antagonist